LPPAASAKATYDSQLDENTLTSEVREVNRGFNRMARELARVEEDRAVMLAGISHDLRTPLARLRLETEMSVEDEEAKHNMALDIDQLDAIITSSWTTRARANRCCTRCMLAELVEREAQMFRDPKQIRITTGCRRPAGDGDETELGRVLQNLFENARRYGHGTYTGARRSHHQATGKRWAMTRARPRPRRAAEKLSELTKPFFRGDAARTAATGSRPGPGHRRQGAAAHGGQPGNGQRTRRRADHATATAAGGWTRADTWSMRDEKHSPVAAATHGVPSGCLTGAAMGTERAGLQAAPAAWPAGSYGPHGG
jgi:hypothetical protein